MAAPASGGARIDRILRGLRARVLAPPPGGRGERIGARGRYGFARPNVCAAGRFQSDPCFVSRPSLRWTDLPVGPVPAPR